MNPQDEVSIAESSIDESSIGFSRRRLLTGGLTASGLFLAATAFARASFAQDKRKAPEPAPEKDKEKKSGPFELPELPYKEDALAPYISANTMSFHYGKHHSTYVKNLNLAVQNNKFKDMPIEKVIAETYKNDDYVGTFNNAAQAWNHSFYWKSMKPGGGGEPSGKLADRIKKDFGSFEDFKKKFSAAATGQFGSGWAWLVLEKDKLSVMKTANADTPIVQGIKPLITCDVWEHAYYLDYQNKRGDYVTAYLDHLVNWEFAASNLA
jgi:Fe-Mn family superoxide dismutase